MSSQLYSALYNTRDYRDKKKNYLMICSPSSHPSCIWLFSFRQTKNVLAFHFIFNSWTIPLTLPSHHSKKTCPLLWIRVLWACYVSPDNTHIDNSHNHSCKSKVESNLIYFFLIIEPKPKCVRLCPPLPYRL